VIHGKQVVFVLDMHSEGEPVRVIVGGLGPVRGASMAEKVGYAREHLDYIRSALLLPPRASREHLGSLVTPPCSPEAHLGVIFMDATGYLAMCGDATIATASAAVNAGLVDVAKDSPETVVNLDTPAGLVSARVAVDGGQARRVEFANVAAFVEREDLDLEVPELGPVRCDIGFGGNFCALVPAEQLGLEVTLSSIRTLKEAGQAVKDAVNSAVIVSHPEVPTAKRVELVMFYEVLDRAHVRNAVIFGDRQIVLSPCGTGSSALLALLDRRGILPSGETLQSESVLGTSYYLRVLRRTTVGGRPSVIPLVRGSAYFTGIYQLILTPDDPLREGILVG